LYPVRKVLNYLIDPQRDMAKLSDDKVDRALESLPGWKHDGDYLEKEFKFKEFLGGIKFVNAVAKIAEAKEHHPDIHIVWTTITLKITTHDEGGLTKWDVELAKAIEKYTPRVKKSMA
jgi:4a-hydroxytetrahydrobiopterin dehydratase